MRIVNFDELSEKEVININDCRRLGYITDICIDIECGQVISFTVKNFTGILPGKNEEFKVPWNDIKKIGDDIIFVDICLPHHQPAPLPQGKKRFFS